MLLRRISAAFILFAVLSYTFDLTGRPLDGDDEYRTFIYVLLEHLPNIQATLTDVACKHRASFVLERAFGRTFTTVRSIR